MKNEDRIVELLAESLKGQDQQRALLKQHSKLLEQHSKLLGAMIDRQEQAESQQKASTERIIASVNALADIVKTWMERTKRIDDHEERISALEQRK